MSAQPANASHLAILGLGRLPFPTTPDAACYFHTPALESELAEAAHCVLSRKGFVLITGEVGLGKSTFVRRLTETVVGQGCAVAFVLNTFLRGEDLLRAINLDFGIKPGKTFAIDVVRLNEFLVAQHARGGTALIIVDDAQNLCLESLELMRMLSNFETNQEKLVQILLCGQPELAGNLANPAIRQLASRIVKHVELRPLDLQQSGNYVNFRLTSAGSEGRISMPPDALGVLHRLSGGNPRRMHLILDRCLYGLVAQRTRVIDSQLVKCAAEESGMRIQHSPMRRRSARIALGFAIAGLATVVAASVLTRDAPVDAMPAQAGLSSPERAHVAVDSAADGGKSGAAPAPELASANAACLARFQLGAEGTRAAVGLRTGDSAALRTIAQAHAPMLQVLDVPVAVQLPDSADACVVAGANSRVVLWHPAAPLANYSFGERGAWIGGMQRSLVRSGDYQQRVDGLAGVRTADAIASFQRRNALDASGFPDPLTRFLIEQQDHDPAPSVSPESR